MKPPPNYFKLTSGLECIRKVLQQAQPDSHNEALWNVLANRSGQRSVSRRRWQKSRPTREERQMFSQLHN
jgi:hypothetical protein